MYFGLSSDRQHVDVTFPYHLVYENAGLPSPMTSGFGQYGPEIDFSQGYPDSKTVHDIANNPVEMPVAPFQYLESHDHSQLICFVGELPGDVPFGDRSKSYKLQPFAIALYTCQGTPMLWQGQEFADNYDLPGQGNGRICFRRDVNWEYYYDDFGVPLVRLYRNLGTLRHTCGRDKSGPYAVESRSTTTPNPGLATG